MKTFYFLILLFIGLAFSYQPSLYLVGGEIHDSQASDVGGSKGYYGIGTQIESFQSFFGHFGQLNGGYVNESVWAEFQAGAMVAFGNRNLSPRIGIGASFMSIREKRMKVGDIPYFIRKDNADGFLKLQGILAKNLFVEWEGKFNTFPNWNSKIGYKF